MILQKEIIKIAESKSLKTETIDKDWVLGHFLNAMFSIKDIKDCFVFKGGTALKKCYFPDYRFSEDLDFTLLGKKIVADEKLIKKIIEKAARNSGIKFHFQNRKIQKSDGKEQAYEIKIKYWGANHKPNQKPLPPSRWQTQIKLDISFTEKLLLPAEQKPILHEYSDNSLISEIIPTYSLIEVLGEKLRSLIQRNRPRDIYDLNYLSNLLPEDSSTSIKNILFEKAKSKGIKINDTHDFVNLIKGRTNKRAWQSSLGNHLPAGELPDFDKVYNKLRQFIEKILNS